jgi:hypothetical protein
MRTLAMATATLLLTAASSMAASVHGHYNSASAGSSSHVAGVAASVNGFEVAGSKAENTSWGTTFGTTALTHSSSKGGGFTFGSGFGLAGYGAGGHSSAHISNFNLTFGGIE